MTRSEALTARELILQAKAEIERSGALRRQAEAEMERINKVGAVAAVVLSLLLAFALGHPLGLYPFWFAAFAVIVAGIALLAWVRITLSKGATSTRT